MAALLVHHIVSCSNCKSGLFDKRTSWKISYGVTLFFDGPDQVSIQTDQIQMSVW